MIAGIVTFFRRASRSTSSGRFIPEIDGLRFIAIGAVVIYHVAKLLNQKLGSAAGPDAFVNLLLQGYIGVQLFFVISGFVIALPFATAFFEGKNPPALKDYFVRRLTRLEPPYILNLLILFALTVLLHPELIPRLFPNLVSSIFYMHSLLFGEMSKINYVAWSLEVELQFYVLAPLLTLLFRISSDLLRRGALVVIIASLALWVPGEIAHLERYNLSIIPQLKYFLTGFLLLDLYLKELPSLPGRSLVWDGVSLAAWGVLPYLLLTGNNSFLFLPILIAYVAAFKGTLSNRFFRSQWVYTIGGMCYTIYLYHSVILYRACYYLLKLDVIKRIPIDLCVLVVSAIVVPVVLVICTILFIYVEKPCMSRTWYLTSYNRIRALVFG